ncbi:MAG: type 1 glutamine amidotransferase domain-containing protein [Rhodospirillales bacterium]|nr:type 1 glutamine amidotransferase domain-containing protein [Rhodospirillales bacterium]
MRVLSSLLVTGVLMAAGALPASADNHGPRILIVATSHSEVPNADKTTGLWLSELTDPYRVFREAGANVDIATITGGPAPIDPRSGSAKKLDTAFNNDPSAVTKFNTAPALKDVDTARYDAVFFAGGHGTMWDFADNPVVAATVSTFVAAGKPVGAVCHGPAALLSARTADGQPIVGGLRVTAFTDREESAAGWTGLVPYSLEQRLKQLGAQFEAAGTFQPYAVRDGLIITGQNPASSDAAAKLLLDAVKERASRAALD